MSFLRKQESRRLWPPQSPSPGPPERLAGLSTAGGEAGCFIRLKCYGKPGKLENVFPLTPKKRVAKVPLSFPRLSAIPAKSQKEFGNILAEWEKRCDTAAYAGIQVPCAAEIPLTGQPHPANLTRLTSPG